MSQAHLKRVEEEFNQKKLQLDKLDALATKKVCLLKTEFVLEKTTLKNDISYFKVAKQKMTNIDERAQEDQDWRLEQLEKYAKNFETTAITPAEYELFLVRVQNMMDLQKKYANQLAGKAT